MSTIVEVAAKAKVSKATVSRVISGITPVSEETKQRVLSAIKELDYVPNPAARSLASKKSYTVGLVLLNLNSSYYPPAASAVESALRQENLHVIIASGQGSLDGERQAVEYLIRRQVDALVLMTSYLSEEELAIYNQRCPVFSLNQATSTPAYKTVSFDNYAGGFMATEYLIKQGHTQIATIMGPQHKPDAEARFRGYQDALEQYNLSSCWHTEGAFSPQSGVEAMQCLINSRLKPTALVCGNDHMAMGVLSVCSQNDISVPNDLAVIGFDDMDIAPFSVPALTTIKVPLFDMSESLAQLLLQQVFHKPYNDIQTQFKPKLIIRQSA